MTTLIFPKNQRQCASFSIKRGYPVSVVQAGHRRAQQIDRQSALQTARKENTDRIPFTLTFHPHISPSHFTLTTGWLNLSFLKNFKLL